MAELLIRTAVVEDAAALLEIYSYYVEHTAITFEYEVPAVEEFADRISHTLEKYPYLAAEKDGEILGYAYAGAFKVRAAYAWACDLSIYVDRHHRKCGVGKALYEALTALLKQMGVINLYACIGSPAEEDEYLTNNSEHFHEHMGFVKVGTFHKCGYKFNRWYNMIWMEKVIGEHSPTQKQVIPFPQLEQN